LLDTRKKGGQYRPPQRVEKVKRSLKTESGERNSVKNAFELGKIPYLNLIQISE